MSNNQNSVPVASNLNAQLAAKNLRTRAVEGLEECLGATHSFYDMEAGKMVVVPDHKTRLAAAIAALAYTDGKPVERREIIQRKFTALEEVQAQVKQSPELRRALIALMPELGEKAA